MEGRPNQHGEMLMLGTMKTAGPNTRRTTRVTGP